MSIEEMESRRVDGNDILRELVATKRKAWTAYLVAQMAVVKAVYGERTGTPGLTDTTTTEAEK